MTCWRLGYWEYYYGGAFEDEQNYIGYKIQWSQGYQTYLTHTPLQKPPLSDLSKEVRELASPFTSPSFSKTTELLIKRAIATKVFPVAKLITNNTRMM